MKVAVVQFWGSNCDHDAEQWSSRLFALDTEMIWFGSGDLHGADLVILPGGFSYGDYLRPGAMAARTPVMEAVVQHARRGGLVLGICNGFQVLCESGLLPGALLRNCGLTFLCRDVYLRCETTDSPFTRSVPAGSVLRVPIAHGDGNYFADAETLKRLKDENRVAFRYVSPKGQDDPDWNVNGSLDAIAGILSEGRNVLGMMPHPERASEELVGSADGALVLKSAVETLEAAHA
jgi:phosphoribosylformylglycinamidine synthase subunit PurQ / glutaminase